MTKPIRRANIYVPAVLSAGFDGLDRNSAAFLHLSGSAGRGELESAMGSAMAQHIKKIPT